MKTRGENGNVQTRKGIFVPPIRRVVYGVLAEAAATTLSIGGPACADAPARDVEDGSVLGEAEAFDAMTGERIAAFMETAKGNQFSFEGLDPIDNARQVIRVWVADFVARVDKVHGY